MSESQHIEWKESWRDEYLKWICGFANADKLGRHWDSMPLPNITSADLDTSLFDYFRKLAHRSERLSEEILAESNEILLEKLHLYDGSYLKCAAALLFHPDPEKYFTGSWIKVGFFESNVDLRYQDEVHGGLLSQVSSTIEVLKAKYLKAWISYEGLQRVETWEVPIPALREAILNAVVHKDYTSGAPIQISVYPNKLMIWNSGLLPPDWDIDKLLSKHSSKPFNPDIANTFFRTGMIESWGRGIERIMEACEAAGVPAPEFQYEQTGLWVTFHYAARETSDSVNEATLLETPPKTPPKLTEMVMEALKHDHSLSISEIANLVGKSESAVKRAIRRLRESGNLERIGPARGGSWKVIEDEP